MAINRTALKTYAPQARIDFIQAMTNRAATFGITKRGVSKGELQGELFIVDGKSFPRAVGNQREKLVERINQTSFEQVMEAVAYTWFNRFLAIRYMELHGYFDHGYRVLSHPQGHKEPEILEEAAHLDLPGLKRGLIVQMKLKGTQDEALYRKILIAQCNDLYRAMPFLFEKIEDETELLLPENLLQSDSIIRKLVGAIDEAEWNNIEIIGWLYQFYISDRKDQVIGKVVQSEDIPAATQLFTPSWIVKYMVQNSLGATWLCTYPDSAIKGMMDYYIEPAAQMSEVQEQLETIAPKSLDPESLTLIDPAVGSGHILVEAYDLFKAIYIERGYTTKEAARLILTKNLYGLDIDDRAAQMAGFALLMKARADDRSLLRDPPRLNVLALQESNGLDVDALIRALLPEMRAEIIPSDDLLTETLEQPTLALTIKHREADTVGSAIRGLFDTFNNAKTYGSLITVKSEVTESLPLLLALLDRPAPVDMLRGFEFHQATERLRILVRQMELLGQQYDCVVANPPYMGGKYYCDLLKRFAEKNFKDAKGDLYGAFILRNFAFSKINGRIGMITIPNWMFLATYEGLRNILLEQFCIQTLIHNGRGVWGADFGSCAFTIQHAAISDYLAQFKRLFSRQGEVQTLEEIRNAFFTVTASRKKVKDFNMLPGRPIAYWLSDHMQRVFQQGTPLGDLVPARQGLATADNSRFVRCWYEVARDKFETNCKSIEATEYLSKKWYPYNKGGDFRKWYGNQDFCVNWEKNGFEIRNFTGPNGKVRSACRNTSYYFRQSISWSDITSSSSAFRFYPSGFVYDVTGMSAFAESEADLYSVLGFCNSSVASALTKALNPTVHFQIGNYQNLPFIGSSLSENELEAIKLLISLSQSDWDSQETSWSFEHPALMLDTDAVSLETSYDRMRQAQRNAVEIAKTAEDSNNVFFIKQYGLEDELSPNVPISEITLNCNPYYRYGGELSETELETRFKSDTMRELISFAVGCMMGRYSLSEPGLIYASAGNKDLDETRYGDFAADADGIIPITEEGWFEDDVANRLEEFLSAAWPNSRLSENLAFLIDGLTKGPSADTRADMRTYLSKKFYADHLQTYKSRPIYWLFSSGRQKAFECLVYMHRYNEGTLARMRTEYITPLMGKMLARIEALEDEITRSSSSAEKSRKTKDVTKFRRQLEELRGFDEELRHLADQRIPLDLDEGVKVNYGKFGNLLAAKDKVCGKLDDAD
ncbi:BREX-1 system adenine-specific DNA-methyltransferase PglX [Rhizobium ruizarguesonis]